MGLIVNEGGVRERDMEGMGGGRGGGVMGGIKGKWVGIYGVDGDWGEVELRL